MNVSVFIIRNRDTDKSVAVLGHDPASGRVVLRTRPSDASLLQTFNIWRDRQILVQVREQFAGRSFTRRFRILPTDSDYGHHLADRFVYRPYEIRFSKVVEGHSLDSIVDEHYNMVDVAPAVVAPSITIDPSSIF